MSNLPIDTDDAIAVDCYRARWMIEELFKALKTWCQFEQGQLESAHSLLNALAILTPVAGAFSSFGTLLARTRERRGVERAHATAERGPDGGRPWMHLHANLGSHRRER